MNAFDLVTSSAWAIRPEWLHAIAEIAAREPLSLEAFRDRIEAVRAEPGKRIEDSRAASVRGNVAVIPIAGPIFRRASFFSDFSGATSVSALATDLKLAIDNPDVASIVLEIDSPGGEVSGIGEFAQMVRDSAKPVHAYVDGTAASAAYWIASAARTITTAPTGLLGSIGVVSTHRKDDAKSAKSVEFVSSRSPNKRPNLDTEKGRATVQKTVDGIADVFIETVAQNRGVSADAVVSDFGAGGVLLGGEAVAAGMADRVGTFESLIADLNRGAPPQRRPAPTRKETAIVDEPNQAEAAQGDETVTISASEWAEVQRQVKAMEAERAQAARSAIATGASAFVADQVRAGRLLPAQAVTATTLIAQAELNDAGHGDHVAAADEKGNVRAVKAADASSAKPAPLGGAIRAFVASLTPHSLTTEHVAGDVEILSNDEGRRAGDEAEARRKSELRQRLAANMSHGKAAVTR